MSTSPHRLILLVDDDHDDADIFMQAVKELDAGIAVHHATEGQQALDILKKGLSPSIIFLDINMPKVNGWQCLMQLKKDDRTKNIPVVMYSTSQQQDDKILSQKLGAIDYIVKPYNFNNLKEEIARVSAQLLQKNLVR